MSNIPATIEIPGATATNASRSIMMPKERFCRLSISQPSVKRSGGISSCSRCKTTDAGIGVLASAIGGGIKIVQK
jgi:hypothetical protein